jgi:hypothetical protein
MALISAPYLNANLTIRFDPFWQPIDSILLPFLSLLDYPSQLQDGIM